MSLSETQNKKLSILASTMTMNEIGFKKYIAMRLFLYFSNLMLETTGTGLYIKIRHSNLKSFL